MYDYKNRLLCLFCIITFIMIFNSVSAGCKISCLQDGSSCDWKDYNDVEQLCIIGSVTKNEWDLGNDEFCEDYLGACGAGKCKDTTNFDKNFCRVKDKYKDNLGFCSNHWERQGIWLIDEKACVECDPITHEEIILADISDIYVGKGFDYSIYDGCESACGADPECDEQLPNSNVNLDEDGEDDGFCDNNCKWTPTSSIEDCTTDEDEDGDNEENTLDGMNRCADSNCECQQCETSPEVKYCDKDGNCGVPKDITEDCDCDENCAGDLICCYPEGQIKDGTCLKANGKTCTKGNECCSGLCVNGKCRSDCSGRCGKQCSTGGTNYQSTGKVCFDSGCKDILDVNKAGWECDANCKGYTGLNSEIKCCEGPGTDNYCRNIATDENNCGACGQSCITESLNPDNHIVNNKCSYGFCECIDGWARDPDCWGEYSWIKPPQCSDDWNTCSYPTITLTGLSIWTPYEGTTKFKIASDLCDYNNNIEYISKREAYYDEDLQEYVKDYVTYSCNYNKYPYEKSFRLEPGVGYLVYANEEVNIIDSSIRSEYEINPTFNIQLFPGINFIGWPDNKAIAIREEALEYLTGGYQYICGK